MPGAYLKSVPSGRHSVAGGVHSPNLFPPATPIRNGDRRGKAPAETREQDVEDAVPYEGRRMTKAVTRQETEILQEVIQEGR